MVGGQGQQIVQVQWRWTVRRLRHGRRRRCRRSPEAFHAIGVRFPDARNENVLSIVGRISHGGVQPHCINYLFFLA